MRLALLAVIRGATGAAYAVLDAPARLRAAVRRVDAAAVQLLDPPAVVIEREQTVPDWLQLRLAADEAQRERLRRMLANLEQQGAELAVLLEQRAAELFALDPFN